MHYVFREMTETDARTISEWRYDGQYSFYDLGPGSVAELLDPAQGYVAVADEAGALVGFCCLGPSAQVPAGCAAGVYVEDALDVGLGLRPDLTGHGLGPAFVRASLAFARGHFAPHGFRLSVATFNERAIRAYAKVGFRSGPCFLSPVRGGATEFLIMTLDVHR